MRIQPAFPRRGLIQGIEAISTGRRRRSVHLERIFCPRVNVFQRAFSCPVFVVVVNIIFSSFLKFLHLQSTFYICWTGCEGWKDGLNGKGGKLSGEGLVRL